MPYKPEVNIRAEVLRDKLFLQSPETLHTASLEQLEAMVQYWEWWVEAVAGLQMFDLLECKTLAEKIIVKKREEQREYKEYMRLKKLATPPVLDI